GASFSYSSDNTAVADVDQNGLITAVCEGTAQITVTAVKGCYTDASDTLTVTVGKGNMSLTVNEPGTVIVGQTSQLSPVNDPAGAIFSYASDNTAVADVNGSGLITAIAVGNANITVTASKGCYNDATATVAVNVQKGEITLSVSGPGAIKAGQTAQLSPVADPAAGVSFAYASDNTSVATVDDNGLVTGICNGTANITVTASKDNYSDATATVAVTVEKGDMDLTVNTPGSLMVGQTEQLSPVSTPAGASFSYESDSPSVATVSDTGLIRAEGLGTATLTVTANRDCYNEKTFQVTVTVTCVRGDINNDGVIDILDVVKVIDIALERYVPTPAEFEAADYNDDGVVNVLDVVQIINKAVE
ncbi:MAG: Ig-like domain-containing protein, partial [Desulfocucumaceae bacterium]